jgi:hypothetical protein
MSLKQIFRPQQQGEINSSLNGASFEPQSAFVGNAIENNFRPTITNEYCS